MITIWLTIFDWSLPSFMSPIRARPQIRRKSKSEIDWSRRYPKNWNYKISPTCLASTHRICTHCWIREAKHTHHLLYRFCFLRPRIWAMGIFIVPLCEDCHKLAHDKTLKQTNNWYKHPTNPLWGNKNRFGYWLNSVIRYWLLRLILLIRGK